MRKTHSILKGPCLTEKALQTGDERVVLKVHSNANKIEIKKAVEDMFEVKVKEVRTANMHGKQKRVGKYIGSTSPWKKAYVTLSEGQINFAEEL
ncbi:MAG: 50S ribosomal protein L23 [Deltaproteobacteria bacterium]|nr:MAG: 50S ribosomal protein L23 [Deltaproteobacteria bacterium]